MRRALSILIFFFAVRAINATTYYISPSGSDSNSGTSSGSPWKTFAHAFPILAPGDTLLLENGTYQPGTGTGFPNITCGSGGIVNGTVGNPITIQAQNERQAWIKGDGSAEPFQMHSCSYWNVVGLHVSDIDDAVQHENDGTFAVYNSSNLLIRRNIVDHNNRCFNLNGMVLLGTTNSIIEENEFYYFHRWAFSINNSGSTGNNEVRRNYSNSRKYFTASNSTCTTYGFGSVDLGAYNSNSNIFENNIGENTSDYGESAENASSNNTFLGSVELNSSSSSFRTTPHTNTTVNSNNSFINDVSISAASAHFWLRGGFNVTIDHGSMFGGTAVMGVGLNPSGTTAVYSVHTSNTQAVNLTNGSSGAFFEDRTIAPNGGSWSHDHDNNYNNATTYNANTNVTSPLALNPSVGTCYLWVPDASPLKGKASDGGDVGANVLYQYLGGKLTTNELWDTTTGSPLFKGATVGGLNDVAGSSLFDIANRLNINQNGCSFPSVYGAATAVAAPTGLTATVN